MREKKPKGPFMGSPRTILKNLRNLDQYLSAFNISLRSTHFELLIAEAFSKILHLPFFDVDNDNPNIPYRVVWKGRANPIEKAPNNEPDAICFCYNFKLLIEATQKTNAKQCSQEFAAAIRHWEDFCNNTRTPKSEVYVLFVCSSLYKDTFRSIKANPTRDCKIVPIETSILQIVLETSNLALSMRHLEIRKLFHDICDSVRNSSSEGDFFIDIKKRVIKWQKDVLNLEKTFFTGLKSYETMRKIGRNYIGMSEILERLQKHPVVKHYFGIIEDRIRNEIIKESLIKESLASILSITTTGEEEIFEPVPQCDFSGRCQRLVNAVVNIR